MNLSFFNLCMTKSISVWALHCADFSLLCQRNAFCFYTTFYWRPFFSFFLLFFRYQISVFNTGSFFVKLNISFCYTFKSTSHLAVLLRQNMKILRKIFKKSHLTMRNTPNHRRLWFQQLLQHCHCLGHRSYQLLHDCCDVYLQWSDESCDVQVLHSVVHLLEIHNSGFDLQFDFEYESLQYDDKVNQKYFIGLSKRGFICLLSFVFIFTWIIYLRGSICMHFVHRP